MKTALVLFVMVLAALQSGCLSEQVLTDGNGIRNVMVELYTDQALDNLIRAFENRPFVQLTYSQVSVTGKENATLAAASGEAAFTRSLNTDVTKVAGLQFTQTNTANTKIPLSLSGQRDRTLAFRADPITDRNDIYEEYLRFARDPSLFCLSCDDPGCSAHIKRKCNDKWYWVPANSGAKFLQLVVKTSFAPPPAATSAISWENIIVSVDPQINANGGIVPGKYILTFLKPIPNDDGLLEVTLRDGRKKWLQVTAMRMEPFKAGVLEQQEKPGPSAGTLILSLNTEFNDTTLPPADATLLPGSNVLFFSRFFPNPNARAAVENQKVVDLLDNIRIQLTKPGVIIP